MAQLPNPITARDFSGGRVSKGAVATALAPVNSVANSINVDFSEIIGNGIVRLGKNVSQQIVAADVLDQSHTAGSITTSQIYGVNEYAQVFTSTKARILGLKLKLTKVGAPSELIVKITSTSGGSPSTSVLATANIDPSLVSTSATVITVVFAPFAFTSSSGVYAITLASPSSDSSDYYIWTIDTAGGYAGGSAYSSTNSGSTWSAISTSIFYFATYTQDFTATLNTHPLGDYSFILAGVQGNVVVFNNPLTGTGVLYYLNNTAWNPSDLIALSPTKFVRFAIMNGYLFEANGSEVMHSSPDGGVTWGTHDCIALNSVIPSLLIVSQNRMLASGYSLYGSRIYFSSIVDPFDAQPVAITGATSVTSGGNSTATIDTATALDLDVGDFVTITGTNTNYTGTWQVTAVNSPTEFEYFVPGVVGSGPITGLSDVIGNFITWNTDPSDGDWIDINPDDGGQITGFANASSLTLVFKNNAMYRLNAIAKTVDAENIFNVGAISQEAIANCLGLTYFYSGNGIYSTDGTFPQQISRVAVQDYINAIQTPSEVYAWDDGFNVYFSIGTVTITVGMNDIRTINNVVLKYSPRDQNWSILSYNVHLGQMADFAVSSMQMYAAEYTGAMAIMNTAAATDDGGPIFYQLETQELEFGDRSHTKIISDKIIVFVRDGNEGMFLVKRNDGNFKSANVQLESRVNVGIDVNFEAEFFTFRWQGEATNFRPVLEGYALARVTDQGVSKAQNQ